MKKFHHYITIFASTTLLLSACSVGKKHTRQEIVIPENFKNSAVVLTSDTLQLSWRKFVQDPLLTSLIEKALSNNTDVNVALLNMQQLELAYKQSKKGLLPTADLSIGANRTWLSSNSLNGSLSDQFIGTPYMDDYSATLRLSWEADIWGKVKMQKEESLANFFGQKENLSALKTRVIVQVIQSYYNLIALDEQLKIAQRNVQLSDSTLNMIRLQYNSSLVSSLAVEQAEAQKKTAELLIPLAHQNMAVEENALSILCGGFPEDIQRTASLDDTIVGDGLATGVPAELLSRRPDVRAAEYAVVAATSRMGLAKAAMYPSISLTPSIGTNSIQFNKWFDLPGSIVKTIAGNIAQPIFQKGALKTNYEISVIEREKIALQFKQSVMVAVSEVSDALAKIKHTEQRLQLIHAKSNALAKATADAALLYKSGMANYLEVITAQNNALQNDLERITVKREKLNAAIDLYRALGGGTDALPPNTP
ncbi:efflux transporter outer membrane subunit [Sphingobacterium sp. BIGb0116]|uniref:efflux transporter outer membrane subunit n=1 Tax=Sphingobacterium sp. BIGb0116 TaxID=2940619 RepID=UPI0021673B27|nr:efflux transporter outer membrane subunit [Sphingobacterium sp. BIGb0116]MCS4163249.1 NodT family efflux transporter outer membrane factor (OMF) lipoprotein [Sphingobacterium sp. BIGb0116]